mmetsp:Transcript_10652/g.25483  ORF Transcript_10652/g.25483 Transcript_10652/m.25483 type:complete len:292 (+) Transcript_10652:52-927(+)
MELVLSAAGEHVVAALLPQDAVAILLTSLPAFTALPEVAAVQFVLHPSRKLGDPQISTSALIGAVASIPGGASAVRHWPVSSQLAGICKRQGTELCCWPLARLALKRQYVAVVSGARFEDALQGGICLWLRSSLSRDPPSARALNGELNSVAELLGITENGSFLLLRHQLLTLDPCRGSPDSPVGLEHAPQAVIAPDWSRLIAFLTRTSPRWIDELQAALGGAFQGGLGSEKPETVSLVTRAQTDDSPDDEGSDDELASWTARGTAEWVSILNPEPLYHAADQFLRGLRSC